MIPLLAASEKGRGQAESPSERRVEMWLTIVLSREIEVLLNKVPQRVIAS